MCCNTPIAIVDSYKYLGLYLNRHLDVEQIVKSIANQHTDHLGSYS